jgi:hypothetical protein
MSLADHQILRVLAGRYVLERLPADAAGAVPVWVAASYDGDLVLVPADRRDEASQLLRRAGHEVVG